MNKLAELSEVFTQLEPDAQDIVVLVAQRLHGGRKQYGDLDLSTDTRDWAVEREEELADAVVYSAALAMKARRERAGE